MFILRISITESEERMKTKQSTVTSSKIQNQLFEQIGGISFSIILTYKLYKV